MLIKKILSGEISNENRLKDKIIKLAEILNIDINDEIKMMYLFSFLQKQHSITKKNIVRILKNKAKNIDTKVLEEVSELPIYKYISLDVEHYLLVDQLTKHQNVNKKSYIRHCVCTLEDVHRYVGINEKITIQGIEVNLTSPRFELYKQSTKCVNCEIVGSFYAVERTNTKRDIKPDWHLNLYGYKTYNDVTYEIMITQDHIIPKAKNGANHISNLQTMCIVCNKKKDSINNEIFKNGKQEVTYFNINNVAKQYGIKLEKNSDYYFWAGSDASPNLNIYNIPLKDKSMIFIHQLTDYSWDRWMDELDKIKTQLLKMRNK